MTTPTIAATNVNSDGTNTTSHTANLPSGISAGDLLIMVAAMDGNTTLSWPAGWTSLSPVTNSGGDGTLEARYRIADGSEGASITITTGASEGGTFISYRITGWHGTTPPEGGTPAIGSSTAPDPSSVTPSWGSADNLFIVVMGWGTSVSAISAYPSNYSLSQVTDAVSNGNIAGAAVAGRALAAGSDDPGAATLGNTSTWVANTLVVRPSGGQTISVGIVAETDSGLTLVARKVRALGIVSETDSGLALTARKVRAVGISTETDSVLAATARKVTSLGIASETDVPLSATVRKIISLGSAAEADSALSLGTSHTISTGQPSESDAALPVTHQKIVHAGIAVEADSVFAVGVRKQLSVGVAQENDSGLSATPRKQLAVGIAVEADSVFSPLHRKIVTAGIAVESDSAIAVTMSGPSPEEPAATPSIGRVTRMWIKERKRRIKYGP